MSCPETQKNFPGLSQAQNQMTCFQLQLYFTCRVSTPDADMIFKEDESIESLEDFEQYEERVHVGRKISKVDSFKRLLFPKVEEKRSKSQDICISDESADQKQRASVRLPQPCDYQVSCMDRHDRWHLLQNKNINYSETDLDGASTVANVNQEIEKFPRSISNQDLERCIIKVKKHTQEMNLQSDQKINLKQNTLPRNSKLNKCTRSEESGYDSDMMRSVTSKSVKSSDRSEESDSSGLSGYTSDTDTDRNFKQQRRISESHQKPRSKSIIPDKPPRKSKELQTETNLSKPIARSNSQPSSSARMSLSAKYNERQEASGQISFKVCEYTCDKMQRIISPFTDAAACQAEWG